MKIRISIASFTVGGGSNNQPGSKTKTYEALLAKVSLVIEINIGFIHDRLTKSPSDQKRISSSKNVRGFLLIHLFDNRRAFSL
jgi:hypothetical protein